MPQDNIRRAKVTRVEGKRRKTRDDDLAVEEPLELRVHDTPVAVIMRTPGDDFALAAGFLFTEGIVASNADIGVISYCANTEDPALRNVINVKLTRDVSLDSLKRNTFAVSSCGICGKAAIDSIRVRAKPVKPMSLSRGLIVRLPDKLRAAQDVFSRTGGLHAAGVFDLRGNLLLLKEDVGRHNAVDKAVGTALLRDTDLSKTILLVSGRASFEIMQKAAVARIPVVCAISAPSSLAVEFARDFKMTLVGLLRGETMNVYAGKVTR